MVRQECAYGKAMIPLLHEPYLPLLQQALLSATPPGAKIAVDVGCGDGTKSRWLRANCAAEALVIGVDRDVAAVQAAAATIIGIVGDAGALPLRDSCVDLIWCVAALALFTDRQRALAEMRRVLRPAGVLVIATAGSYWVRLRQHPPSLLTSLPPTIPLPPADGLGEEWTLLLTKAGFQEPQMRAYLLDGDEPAQAALIDSADLAQYLGSPLVAGPIAEPEPRPLLLVVSAHR